MYCIFAKTSNAFQLWKSSTATTCGCHIVEFRQKEISFRCVYVCLYVRRVGDDVDLRMYLIVENRDFLIYRSVIDFKLTKF